MEIGKGSERDKEREEILMQGRVQGKISVPRRCLWLRCISDFTEETANVTEF